MLKYMLYWRDINWRCTSTSLGPRLFFYAVWVGPKSTAKKNLVDFDHVGIIWNAILPYELLGS